MAERATKKTSISRVSIVLTNAIQAEKGHMALVDTATGLATIGAASATLIPIGYFEENLLGNGTLEVLIRLFNEVWLHWFDNDTGGTPVVAADLLSTVFVLDSETVSGDGTARVPAGRMWALNTVDGVGVEMDGFNADADLGVPAATIVSGEYVATLTDVTNVAASVLVAARFIRIGNQVQVFFEVTVDPTAAAATELGISLPVVSALAAAADLTGHANSGETVGEPATIAGDAANDRAALTYTAVGTGVVTWAGSFSYRVL